MAPKPPPSHPPPRPALRRRRCRRLHRRSRRRRQQAAGSGEWSTWRGQGPGRAPRAALPPRKYIQNQKSPGKTWTVTEFPISLNPFLFRRPGGNSKPDGKPNSGSSSHGENRRVRSTYRRPTKKKKKKKKNTKYCSMSVRSSRSTVRRSKVNHVELHQCLTRPPLALAPHYRTSVALGPMYKSTTRVQ